MFCAVLNFHTGFEVMSKVIKLTNLVAILDDVKHIKNCWFT